MSLDVREWFARTFGGVFAIEPESLQAEAVARGYTFLGFDIPEDHIGEPSEGFYRPPMTNPLEALRARNVPTDDEEAPFEEILARAAGRPPKGLT